MIADWILFIVFQFYYFSAIFPTLQMTLSGDCESWGYFYAPLYRFSRVFQSIFYIAIFIQVSDRIEIIIREITFWKYFRSVSHARLWSSLLQHSRTVYGSTCHFWDLRRRGAAQFFQRRGIALCEHRADGHKFFLDHLDAGGGETRGQVQGEPDADTGTQRYIID